MREPHFWRDIDPRSRAAAPVTRALLTPLAWLYSWAGARRIAKQTTPFDPGVPVICVGNLTLGGAGKTPVSSEIRAQLGQMGLRAATLSRGYGGSENGPLRIDSSTHVAAQVGDEPLMLAQNGEAWIARARPDGAQSMAASGVQAIIMDDGHQNPSLRKTLSIVVVDASEPFGNGHVFPKGPLREPVARGLGRADAVVLMGDGAIPASVSQSKLPVLRARLAAASPPPPGAYVAFAGIGRPQRFFDTLSSMPGVRLADAVPFPDHHPYTRGDFDYLEKLAKERSASLITTEKDYMRLTANMRERVRPLPVSAVFDDPGALDELLRMGMQRSAVQ
jgi:tetraacyldisaccharide 4'-kinase